MFDLVHLHRPWCWVVITDILIDTHSTWLNSWHSKTRDQETHQVSAEKRTSKHNSRSRSKRKCKHEHRSRRRRRVRRRSSCRGRCKAAAEGTRECARSTDSEGDRWVVSVIMQGQVVSVRVLRSTVEVFADRVVDILGGQQRNVSSAQRVRKNVENAQVHVLNKVVDTLVVEKRQVLLIQKVQKSVDVPDVQYVDKIVGVWAMRQCQVQQRNQSWRRLTFFLIELMMCLSRSTDRIPWSRECRRRQKIHKSSSSTECSSSSDGISLMYQW